MIKKFVGADAGVSFISESFAKDQVKAGEVKLLSVEGVDLWRELGLVYRRDRSLPRAAQALITLIREHKNLSEHTAEGAELLASAELSATSITHFATNETSVHVEVGAGNGAGDDVFLNLNQIVVGVGHAEHGQAHLCRARRPLAFRTSRVRRPCRGT